MSLNEQWIQFSLDGQRCWGMLHLPQNAAGPHPCVLMLHGFTGTHLEPHRLFVHMARAFAANGIAAFRFDFRGSGNSEGGFEEMTPSREVEDARTALKLLRAHPQLDPQRTGLMGLSMGGMISALTVAHERVKALCLWAPASSHIALWSQPGLDTPERIRAAFAAGFAGAEFPPGIGFDAQSGHMDFSGNPVGLGFFEDLFVHDSLESVQAHTGPSLVVHGTADPTVPFAVGQQYAQALGTHLHAIEGAGHTFERIPHQAEAIAVTLELFKSHL